MTVKKKKKKKKKASWFEPIFFNWGEKRFGSYSCNFEVDQGLNFQKKIK